MLRNFFSFFIILSCIILLTSCSRKIIETGKASYYADKFEGRKTASGENFSQHKLTAAHKTLPFGIIDISRKAAKKIGLLNTGVAEVEIKYKKKKSR